MDDEELDTSYEGLWRLAERIGDVKPKGAPTSLVMELPVKRFSTRPNMTEEQLKCSICISEYEEGDEQQILPCLHCFHSECVQQWLKQSNACPM
ncbi:hypothetical protein BJ742DRAFT_684343 [Cladochytrium replicatum]|nr:hypothetical protein BJ742DRAFT_684343 [Cladochytrium replicatum]